MVKLIPKGQLADRDDKRQIANPTPYRRATEDYLEEYRQVEDKDEERSADEEGEDCSGPHLALLQQFVNEHRIWALCPFDEDESQQ